MTERIVLPHGMHPDGRGWTLIKATAQQWVFQRPGQP